MNPHPSNVDSANPAHPRIQGIGTLLAKRTERTPTGDPASSLVSVVIPCYNYAGYLSAAVESAVNQCGVKTQVIVVDDCSTDDSLEKAHQLAERYPNVQVLAHAKNSGPVQTFNDGLAASTGEYLVRLDADDLLTPGSLGRAVAVFQEHDSVGIVYGHPLHFTDDSLPTPRLRATALTLWPGVEWLARRCHDGLNVITSPEVVMRKSVVDQVGGQLPLAHTHDMEMWLRLAAFSDVAYIRGCDQAWHREHASSLSAQKVDIMLDLAERRLAFDTLFSGAAGAEPWAPALRKRAEIALDRAGIAFVQHEMDRGIPDQRLFDLLLEQLRAPDESTAEAAELLRQLATRPPSLLRKIHAFRRRLLGRVNSQRAWRRWHRFGEYLGERTV